MAALKATPLSKKEEEDTDSKERRMAESEGKVPMEEEEQAEVQESKEEVTDLSDSNVVTKYQEAAKIANLALSGVIGQCQAGARVLDLCKFGDTVITARCAQIYRQKKGGKTVDKGIAFPTSVSVNECVCHNNPLESEGDASPPLAEGDLVKIDMGCHIDGYIAMVAHTVKVGNLEPSKDNPISGKEADVLLACRDSAEVAARLIKPGNTNKQVTEAVAKVAEAYGVNLVQATSMHQMRRFVMEGSKTIALKEDIENKVDEAKFEAHEVYVVDVAVSSGDGKSREQETRTTVFKRTVDKTYRLKSKASRDLVNVTTSKFSVLPFCLRAIGDEKTARMGVVECLKHELLHPYPVLYERPGDVVAHVKFTVLVMASGTSKITGVEMSSEGYTSESKVDEETAAILAEELGSKKKKKKAAAKAAAAAATA